jgi:hypothetical protein
MAHSVQVTHWRAAAAAMWRDRRSRWLLGLCLLWHLVVGAAFHLSPDEAHYALYASRLAWSYYDHPPLVGWVQLPAVWAGAHDLGLRVMPLLCWVLSAVGLVSLTQAWSDPAAAQARPHQVDRLSGAAWMVLILWALAPLPQLLGLALVPDTLLMPLVCVLMGLVWRLSHAEAGKNTRVWCLLGLVLGLAGLAKYTAVLLGLGALAALSWAHGLAMWRSRGPWLALALALAAQTPVLAWNAAHDWGSFAYQFGHASGGGSWRAWRPPAYALAQLGVYGVLPLMGLLVACVNLPNSQQAEAAAGARRHVSVGILSMCFGLPTLLLCIVLSGRAATLPHWTAPAWVALLPFAAMGCNALWLRRRAAVTAAGALQLLLMLAMSGLLLFGGVGRETGAQATSPPGVKAGKAPTNPVADLYGWDDAARQAAALARAHGVSTLAVMNWSLASRIAWYARPLPVKVVDRHRGQFDLWFGALKPGDDVVLIDWSLMTRAPPEGPGQFSSCRLLGQQEVRHLGGQLAHFSFLLCRGWQGQPATATQVLRGQER